MSIEFYFRAGCPNQGFAECLYGFREKKWNKYIKNFNHSENFRINFGKSPGFCPAIGNTGVINHRPLPTAPLLCFYFHKHGFIGIQIIIYVFLHGKKGGETLLVLHLSGQFHLD